MAHSPPNALLRSSPPLLLVLLLLHLSRLSALTTNSFIYDDGFRSVNLILTGKSLITSTGALQLTNHRNLWSVGHAFYHEPLQFKNPSDTSNTTASFSTQFIFAIVSGNESLGGGNGFTFAVAPSVLPNATGGDYLGLVSNSTNGNFSNHVFAVEFDTVSGTWLKDIDDNHVGVNFNGVISDTSQTAAYFTEDGKNETIDLKSGNMIQAWVDYNGSEKLLNVTLAPIPFSSKPIRPLISYSVDLYLVFLDFMYVGFTSGSSNSASDHDILAWSFAINGESQDLSMSNLPIISKKETPIWKSASFLPYTTAFTALFFLMLGVISYLVYRTRKFDDKIEEWEEDYPHRLPYREIYKATKGFNDKEVLGRGGFGSVYTGVLPSSGLQVAVKKMSHNGKQGLREFVSEVSSLGRLRHRNLVQLQGWCRRKEELLLVYEFMPNGSLDTFLFGKKERHLSWEERFKILKGIASGLLYLHEGWEQVVVHRDVKASNVLLDAQLNGKLGDFGLARLYEHGTNPQTTHIVGTLGYMAPELFINGKATTSSDVFSFGAFLLEVASGRRPVEITRPSDEVLLLNWVYMCWKKGNLLCVMDERLEMKYVKAEAELVLKLGVLCSQLKPEARPSMRQVVQPLEEVPLEKLIIEDDIDCDQLSVPHSSSDQYTSRSSSSLLIKNTDDSQKFYSNAKSIYC